MKAPLPDPVRMADPTFNTLFEPEELDPELARYLSEIKGGSLSMMALRHPLVYCVLYNPALNKLSNLQYREKKKAIEEAAKEGDVARIIALHERPYRLSAFLDYSHLVTPVNKGRLLRDLWSDSENIYECKSHWEVLLNEIAKDPVVRAGFAGRHINSLPEEMVVYRGIQGEELYTWEEDPGYSWTLSERKALWFANRFNGHGKVLRLEIQRNDVLAYIKSRGEEEIVLSPRSLERLAENMREQRAASRLKF